MPRTPTLKSLHRRLTQTFNRYVRLRDTELVDGELVGTCISCFNKFPFAKLQAGHFIPAHFPYLRYNETNVNAQCARCNGYLHGNPFGYMLGLAEAYDKSVPYDLCEMQHYKKTWKMDELLEMINTYRQKVNELE